MHAWVSESIPEMRLRTAGICLWVISLWMVTWRTGRLLLAGTELRGTEERILALPTFDSFPRPVFRFPAQQDPGLRPDQSEYAGIAPPVSTAQQPGQLGHQITDDALCFGEGW